MKSTDGFETFTTIHWQQEEGSLILQQGRGLGIHAEAVLPSRKLHRVLEILLLRPCLCSSELPCGPQGWDRIGHCQSKTQAKAGVLTGGCQQDIHQQIPVNVVEARQYITIRASTIPMVMCMAEQCRFLQKQLGLVFFSSRYLKNKRYSSDEKGILQIRTASHAIQQCVQSLELHSVSLKSVQDWV